MADNRSEATRAERQNSLAAFMASPDGLADQEDQEIENIGLQSIESGSVAQNRGWKRWLPNISCGTIGKGAYAGFFGTASAGLIAASVLSEDLRVAMITGNMAGGCAQLAFFAAPSNWVQAVGNFLTENGGFGYTIDSQLLLNLPIIVEESTNYIGLTFLSGALTLGGLVRGCKIPLSEDMVTGSEQEKIKIFLGNSAIQRLGVSAAELAVSALVFGASYRFEGLLGNFFQLIGGFGVGKSIGSMFFEGLRGGMTHYEKRLAEIKARLEATEQTPLQSQQMQDLTADTTLHASEDSNIEYSDLDIPSHHTLSVLEAEQNTAEMQNIKKKLGCLYRIGRAGQIVSEIIPPILIGLGKTALASTAALGAGFINSARMRSFTPSASDVKEPPEFIQRSKTEKVWRWVRRAIGYGSLGFFGWQFAIGDLEDNLVLGSFAGGAYSSFIVGWIVDWYSHLSSSSNQVINTLYYYTLHYDKTPWLYYLISRLLVVNENDVELDNNLAVGLSMLAFFSWGWNTGMWASYISSDRGRDNNTSASNMDRVIMTPFLGLFMLLNTALWQKTE